MTADRLTVAVSLCVLNTASNRLSVRVNVVFLFAKLLALAIIIVGGVVAFATGQSWGLYRLAATKNMTNIKASQHYLYYCYEKL